MINSKLTPTQVGSISHAIGLAIGKACRMNPVINNYAEDIEQASWVKVLAGYDATKAATSNKVRANRETTPVPGMSQNVTGVKQAVKMAYHTDDSSGYAALAYRIAYREAIDTLRNRGMYRHCDASLDATLPGDEGEATMVDCLPSRAIGAFNAMRTIERDRAVDAALGTLNDSERRALDVALEDERALTGGERIAKMRAVAKLQEAVSARL